MSENMERGMNEQPKDVIAELEMIKQQCSLMGANDYEIPALNELIKGVQSGDISKEDALNKANEILNSKQSYH